MGSVSGSVLPRLGDRFPSKHEGRTCLEVLDSVEGKKIPVKRFSHLGKMFSSIKK